MATPRDHTGSPEDAIEMLKTDHQKVRELFQDYESAQDQKAKSKIAQRVFVELETHAQLEETVFYPGLVNDRQGNFGLAVGFSAPAWMPSKESGNALRSHDEFDA